MAVVIQVTQYQAKDGSLYLTEHECDAHDFKLENGAKIELYTDNFLNATGAIDRSRNMQKNTIEAFLSYHLDRVNKGTVEEVVERTKFDTPKAEKEVVDAAAEQAEAAVAEPVDGEEPAPVF